jgi:hypothetical protein
MRESALRRNEHAIDERIAMSAPKNLIGRLWSFQDSSINSAKSAELQIAPRFRWPFVRSHLLADRFEISECISRAHRVNAHRHQYDLDIARLASSNLIECTENDGVSATPDGAMLSQTAATSRIARGYGCFAKACCASSAGQKLRRCCGKRWCCGRCGNEYKSANGCGNGEAARTAAFRALSCVEQGPTTTCCADSSRCEQSDLSRGSHGGHGCGTPRGTAAVV